MIALISFRAFINFPNFFYQLILNRFYRYFYPLERIVLDKFVFPTITPRWWFISCWIAELLSYYCIRVNSPCLKINKSMARLDGHTVVHEGLSRTSHFQLDISMLLIKLLVAGKVNNVSTKKLREDRLRWANWYDFF